MTDRLTEVVFLASLCAELPVDQTVYSATEVLESGITPARYFNIVILNRLISSCRLKATDTKGNELKVIDSESVLHVKQFELAAENNDEELRQHISEIVQNKDQSVFDELGLQLKLAECIAFIEEQLPELRLSRNLLSLSPPEEFRAVLKEYTLDELMLLIWRCCQNLTHRDIRLAVAMNKVEPLLSKLLKSAYEYYEGYTGKGMRPKKFKRNRILRSTSLKDIIQSCSG